MNDDTTVTKAGQIMIKESKWGIEFYAFSHERKRPLHIGTLSGQTYEKCTAILHSPEPSISLAQSEYGAAVDAGAIYFRCIPTDKSATYSIAFADFKAKAISYFNPAYGPQLRVPLSAFQFIGAVRPRNLITDNPSQARAEMILPHQLPMFGKQ